MPPANYRCGKTIIVVKNKNRLRRMVALKLLHKTGCGDADRAFQNVAATVNLGGVADLGFWILDSRPRPLISLAAIFVLILLFYRAAGLACCTLVPLVLPRGWLGMDLRRALGRIVPGVLPRRWLGTGSFRLLTAARRTPAGRLASADKRIAQRIGSRATTMHII